MPKRHLRKLGALLAGVLAVTALAACGDDSTEAGAQSDEGGGGKAKASLTIGYIPWDEDIAVTYLWQHALEEAGYDVTLEQLDVAPTFVGVAKGDIDLFFDTWLPTTHEDYWSEYGDQVEDLGVWYDNAKLTIAVPDYVDATTIADLEGMESTFDGKIIGIEAGAGLTRVTRDDAMPAYGLGGYDLTTSSTTAMLAALRSATADEKPIVVTLWRPHWAYAAFPIKDLEDPEGAMGAAEEIHVIGRKGFSADFADLAAALADFTMDDDMLGSLEEAIFQDNPDDPAAGVAAWVADNQDWFDSLLG